MVRSFHEDFFNHQAYRNYYIESGEGDPIVFLHPLGASSAIWRAMASRFIDTHRVLAVDCLGFGRSDKPDISYALKDAIDRLFAFFEYKGIEKASLVGNSMGGQIALMMGIFHPTRVSKIVVANSSGLKSLRRPPLTFGISWGTRIAGQVPVYPSRKMMENLLFRVCGSTKVHARELAEVYETEIQADDSQLWRRAFSRYLLSIFGTDLDGELSEMDRPTMIIWGLKDRLLGSSGGKKFHKLLPNSVLMENAKAGHFPHLDTPDWFYEKLSTYLTKSDELGRLT